MDVLLFLIFLAACFGAAATGALFPTGPWYERLNKPSWVPPNWAFPVVWTTLYFLIAFAGARVAILDDNAFAMAFWAAQIAFNALWTPVFFGLRMLKGSLPIMAALWLSVLGAMITHWQLDWIAGLVLLPYLIWVSIAAALNVQMWRLNPDQEPLRPAEL
ncbi:tryptophan-rich sensory protein TspO [Histidinibacterium aquaticum]|uniref:Tryptophan-rich sensory protein n=1 Tax=Histidinibacterium aquaticum TaxID=2613962 RepID=A0A5J5GH35_9RHOB|nr:TspO/MBR family protein [Histidinibacterium aquaticum]KAA9006844.1 tryptophan-rich sensory protein [Histidinibacterium aquaticum]